VSNKEEEEDLVDERARAEEHPHHPNMPLTPLYTCDSLNNTCDSLNNATDNKCESLNNAADSLRRDLVDERARAEQRPHHPNMPLGLRFRV